MQFLIGDIIVLGIIIAVLVYFRRSDRDNRSLEKVKRFSDKAMEDVALIADRKAQELRDMSIEVDVHQQASKQAIERLREAEEALNLKTRDMEDLRVRMDTYNNALVELVSMTQKAEENISRLRDESLYIDKVGRRIRSASGQLDQIEERIPRVLSEIQSQNRSALQQAQSDVSEAFAMRIDELDSSIQSTKAYTEEILDSMRQQAVLLEGDLSNRADAYRRAFDEIESDYNKRLERTAARGISLEDEVFQEVMSRIDQHRLVIDNRARETDALYEARLQELADFVESARAEIGDSIKRINEMGDARFSEASVQVMELVDMRRREFMSDIDSFKADLESWHHELLMAYRGDREALERELESEKHSVERHIGDFRDKTEAVAQQLQQALEQAEANQELEAGHFVENMRGRMGELEKGIFGMEEEIAGKLRVVHEQGVQLADNLLHRISQNVDSKTDSMRAAMEQRVEEVNARVNMTHHEIEESFSELRSRVDVWINDSRSYITGIDQQVRELNESSRQANLEHQRTVENHILDTRKRLDGYEGGLSNRVQNLEEYISRAEEMVRDEFKRLEGLAGELSNRHEGQVQAIFENSRTRIMDDQNRLLKDVQADIEAGQTKTIQGVIAVREDIDGRVQSYKSEMESAMVDLKSRMAEMSKVQDAMSTGLTGWQAGMTALQAAHDQSLSALTARMQDATTKGEAALLENLLNSKRNYEQAFQKQKDELDGRIGQLQSDAEVLSSKVYADFQARVQSLQKHAQELYGQIQNELDSSFGTQQQRLHSLLSSVEEDILKLQRVSSESTVKLAEWESSIRNSEELVRSEIQGVRDFARQTASQQVEVLKVDFQNKQQELSGVVAETVAKLKSDIGHTRSDVEQDIGMLRGQIELVKKSFQEQMTSLEGHARDIEGQAIAGLTNRVEELKDETRQLARKYQEEFSQSMVGIQASIQVQNEQYQGELRKVQGLSREVQAQYQKINDDADRQREEFRQGLEKEQLGSAQLLTQVKEYFVTTLQETKTKVDGQIRDSVVFVQGDLEKLKKVGEEQFQTVLVQVQKWQADYHERIKMLVAEASTMRQESMAGIQDRINAMRDEGRKIAGTVVEDIAKIVNDQKLRIEMDLKQIAEEGKRIDDLHGAARTRFQEIQDILGKAETSALREVNVLRDKTREMVEEVRLSVHGDLQRQRDDLVAQISAGIALSVQEKDRLTEAFGEQVDSMEKTWKNDLESLRVRISTERNEFMNALNNRLSNEKATAEDTLRSITEQAGENKRLGNEMGDFLTAIQVDLQKRGKELEMQIAQQSSQMAQNIIKETSAREQAAFTDIEKRLVDYESEIGYRMAKLETVNNDISGLESALRTSMDNLGNRLKDDLRHMGEAMTAKRLDDAEMARKDMEGLRLEMLGMEKEIDELKKRAYDNVNGKLKVFEDEFFIDIASRSEKMQTALQEWREKVTSAMNNIESEWAKEREHLEQAYTDMVKQRLAEIQERVYGGFERLENQYADFQQGITQRMDGAEKQLAVFDESLSGQIKDLKVKAAESAGIEFNRVQGELEQKLKQFERDVEQRIVGTDQDVRARANDLTVVMETVRSDVSVWQAQVLQQIKAGETSVQTDVAGFRARTGQIINEIREEFSREKDGIISASSEERNEIKREMEELATRLQRISSEIELKGREAVDAFMRQYHGFHTEMSKQNKDLADEVENRMGAFRSTVVETRVEFDNLQKRLFGKVEDDARVLDINLKEIDKRIKSFMTHTKLFEKADTLKDELEIKIQALRQELEMIEHQKQDLINMDPVIEKVRHLTDEVNEKFDRLMNEKRRLDGIDEDFRRLTGLSQMVDAKLSQVTAASDTLTQMQLTLRHVDETQKTVDAKLDRLEKKSRLAEATSETVDANFQALQEMEDRMRDLREIYGELPARVKDTQDKVNALIGGKKDVDSAVRSLGSIDKILKDVESRMAELQKNREWLARTETRIGEITRDAEQQVNLLGNLVKSEMRVETRETGNGSIANMNSRDLVLKLAHKGWKTEEIAKTTKLSRGEVELILEMNNK